MENLEAIELKPRLVKGPRRDLIHMIKKEIWSEVFFAESRLNHAKVLEGIKHKFPRAVLEDVSEAIRAIQKSRWNHEDAMRRDWP